MGQIVAASVTVHGPQLITRPPDENQEQLDGSIAAMRQLGKDLDEAKPDVVIVLGQDHLESFSLKLMPTFAIVTAERVKSDFAHVHKNLAIHQPLANQILHHAVESGIDMAYTQEIELGHSFLCVAEYILEERQIPVVPIFVNCYAPPLPHPRRCQVLGQAIRRVIDARPAGERIAVIASGGMSHYPGTPKYYSPEYEFDHWAIGEIEKGNLSELLDLSPKQLDQVGNTELLTWMTLFGIIGENTPGELLSYQPINHHGHGVLRFFPRKRVAATV